MRALIIGFLVLNLMLLAASQMDWGPKAGAELAPELARSNLEPLSASASAQLQARAKGAEWSQVKQQAQCLELTGLSAQSVREAQARLVSAGVPEARMRGIERAPGRWLLRMGPLDTPTLLDAPLALSRDGVGSLQACSVADRDAWASAAPAEPAR